MSMRVLAAVLIVSWCCASASSAAPASPLQATAGKPTSAPQATAGKQVADGSQLQTVRAQLDKYCVTCHNERRKAQFANLAFDSLDVQAIGTQADTWERVVRKLRGGVMPPAGMPRPAPPEYTALVQAIEQQLDRAADASPNPGRLPVHRLNRVEYANAIRDLLAVEIDARALLPADDSSYGFDNIGDVLTVSPGLLERYMLAARKISREALGDRRARASTQVYKNSRNLRQDTALTDDLPFGTRGGMVVRHHFAVDAEYAFKIELQKDYYESIRGTHEPNQVDVFIDDVRVQSFLMEKSAGTMSSDGGVGYGGVHGALAFRMAVRAGAHEIGIAIPRRDAAVAEGVGPAQLPVGSTSYQQANRSDERFGRIPLGVESLQIDGPFSVTDAGASASRRRVFTCYPARQAEEEPCAGTILSALARSAYRRPASKVDLDRLLTFFQVGRAQAGFEAGIQLALERLLVAPAFLFRVEQQPAGLPTGTLYRIGDLDLASRLSFFLWSSIPDATLLDLAEKQELRKPEVLERQVHRMLADPRSKSLVGNFFGQWLYLRNLRLAAPDPTEFPDFDDNLREAMIQETELFLDSQLREDRSALELFSANYTFVNERLARHYGMTNVYGNHFRRVTLADDRRAGLLGQASILTVTSYNHRTSPVQRGKWLLQNLLGTPPPAPPANVPPFDEAAGQARPKSVRARMELHRKNPVCAACHSQLDPLGFGLENFDAVGAWRTIDGSSVVDASGAFPDGTKFDGPSSFRRALLNQPEPLMRTLAEKLLTYALGRGAAYYDMPAVRKVVAEAASANYRWSSLILGVVKSAPFQMRRSE